MQLLFLFAVGVLFGSAACDIECFKPLFHTCLQFPIKDCEHLKSAYECATLAASFCHMGLAGDAMNVSLVLQEVCTEGNPLRSNFLQQKECYTEAMDFEKCFYLVYNMTDYIEGPEDFIKMNKEGCRNSNVYSDCVSSRVKRNCGDLSTFNYVFSPMLRLGQGLCEEVILPADEKEAASQNLGLLNIFSIIVLSFYKI